MPRTWAAVDHQRRVDAVPRDTTCTQVYRWCTAVVFLGLTVSEVRGILATVLVYAVRSPSTVDAYLSSFSSISYNRVKRNASEGGIKSIP